MLKLPKIGSYGEYSSSNYGAHCLKVEIGTLGVWFSYDTPVAFMFDGEFHIRKNDWSSTTGKHLNWIDDDRKIRENAEVFEANFARVLERIGL